MKLLQNKQLAKEREPRAKVSTTCKHCQNNDKYDDFIPLELSQKRGQCSRKQKC